MPGGIGFDELTAAIDGVDIPVDGDALAEALRLLDLLTAKVTVAAGAFDAGELWKADGAASLASWLRCRAGLTDRDASRRSATARRLRRCPVTARAWLDGTLSGGQVQAITANLDDRTTPLYADHEADLVPVLSPLEVRDTTLAMRDWAAKARATLDQDDPVEPPGKAHLSSTLDGRGRLDADLTAEGHQLARAALRVALDPKRDDDPRTPAQKRHDALLNVFRFFLDHQAGRGAARHRPHLNVMVDLSTLIHRDGSARYADGTPLDAETARRMACDANVHRVVTRGRSEVLDYGRATRTVTTALFTVLALRDHGCRFPGCDRPTDPGNLVLLCPYHHHSVIHGSGWSIVLEPDATVRVTDPRGRCRTSRPPPHAHAHAA